MNRRKVLGILLLALITAFIAVSCSGNIEAPASSAEELSYVTFGNGHTRELGTSYWTEDYDDLYWFYTATKTDEYGTTGSEGLTGGVPTAAVSKSGDNPAKGLSGRVGPFSQGSWTFKLYAYAGAVDSEGTEFPDKTNLIYASDDVSVILKGGEVKNIPVSVTPQGDVGYVKFNNAYFEWAGASGDAVPKMKITLTPASGSPITTEITLNAKSDNKLSITNGTSIETSVPVGYYTANVIVYLKQAGSTTSVEIDNEDTPIFSQTFGLRVYGNAITYITGNMTEGLDSYVTFDVAEQTMKVFTVNKDENTEVKSAITSLNGNKESAEVNNPEDYTTVTFPVGVLDSSSVHQLDMKVTPTASAEDKFQISGTESGKAAVAGLDLSLIKITKQSDGSTVQESVTLFDKDVIITTYIAKDLENVSVWYRNYETKADEVIAKLTGTEAADAVPSYDKTTGKLIFKTNHFSEYFVKADAEAMNTTTGMVYSTFADAVDRAGNGQEVKLLKDASVKNVISISNDIVIDLNGKNVTGKDSRVFNLKKGTLEIKGSGTISSLKTEGSDYEKDSSVIRVGANDVETGSIAKLILGENSKIVGLSTYGITVFGSATSEVVEINGTVESYDRPAISGVGTSVYGGTDIIVNGTVKLNASETRDEYANAIYQPQSGTLTINGTVEGGIEAKAGDIIISSSASVKADDNVSPEHKAYSNGCSTKGYAIAAVNNKSYACGVNVEIANGATVTGSVGIFDDNDIQDKEKAVVTSVGNAIETIPGFKWDKKWTKDSIYSLMETWEGREAESYSTPISSDKIITINTAEEFALFAKQVNGGTNYSGYTVILETDIDLKGYIWTPIQGYQGSFDGQNHTIYNLMILGGTTKNYQALFGKSWTTGTYKNVTLENVFVTGNSSIAAFVADTGPSTIENVTVKGDIYIGITTDKGYLPNYSSAYAGVIYGHGYATIKNCHVVGNEGSIIAGGRQIGGIYGYGGEGQSIRCENCTVENLTIIGTKSVGGIIGWAHYGNGVKDCTVKNVNIQLKYYENSIGFITGTTNSEDNPAGSSCEMLNNTVVDSELYVAGSLVSDTPDMNSMYAAYGMGYYYLYNNNNYVFFASYDDALKYQNNHSGYEVGFTTFNAQIGALPDESTFSFSEDCEIGRIELLSDKTITLDLAGHCITVTGADAFLVKTGTLIVKDSVGGGKINHTGKDDLVWLQNSGTLRIDGGEYSFGTKYGITYGTGNLIVNDGSFVFDSKWEDTFKNYVASEQTVSINGTSFTKE